MRFDLNELPFKGDAEQYRKDMNEMAAWMQRASSRVVRVQARVRGFITLRRNMRDKAAGTGIYAPKPKPTPRTPRSTTETPRGTTKSRKSSEAETKTAPATPTKVPETKATVSE